MIHFRSLRSDVFRLSYAPLMFLPGDFPFFRFSTQQTPAELRKKGCHLALGVLWWALYLLTLLSVTLSAAALLLSGALVTLNPAIISKYPFAIYIAEIIHAYGRSFLFTNIAFDVFVLYGLKFFFFRYFNDKPFLSLREDYFLSFFALALVLGRPSTFFSTAFIAIIPDSWWLLWPVKYVLLPPLVLIAYGTINITVLYFASTVFLLAVVAFPLKVFSSVLKISDNLTQAKAQHPVFMGALLRFSYWITGREWPKAKTGPDESKGARFAELEEAARLYQPGPGSMAFGHLHNGPFFLKNEKHVLVMASTRSGKGVSLIIPHLLRYPGSAFVLDPKGENAIVTGRRREELNEKVLYLDPFGISGKPKARFNPLARFTPETMEAESKALAAALVMGEFGKRDHWTASARQLVAAVILYVVTSPLIPPERKDLGIMRRLLLGDINTVLNFMLESDAADGLLARLARSFLQTPEKEFGSILSTAQRETEILDNPFILDSLMASGPGDEVDFSDWHKGTMTVFLCLSAPKFPNFSRWLRLVLTSALDEMTDTLDPPTLPVCFMLDELATLGHLQIVEDAIGLSAGYGVQIVSVFQDVAQMRDLYKGRWASFISNAGVKAIFSLNDYDSAHYWSQTLGNRLFETRSQQQDLFGLTKGQSKGETMRPLLASDKLMALFAQKRMLVLPEGSHAIVSERVGYFEDQTLIGMWDDPRGEQEKQPEADAPPPVVAPVPQQKNDVFKKREKYSKLNLPHLKK